MAILYVWGMYKFDISALSGTINTAKFNLYLDSSSVLSAAIGQPVWHAQSANGTDDQDWTTADTGAKLYNNICEYTRSNFSFQDRREFDPAFGIFPGFYYDWDVAVGLQDAIDKGDQFFTLIISRDVGQGTGTITKAGAAATPGPINRGGSGERLNWQTSEGANPPFVDFSTFEIGAGNSSGFAIATGAGQALKIERGDGRPISHTAELIAPRGAATLVPHASDVFLEPKQSMGRIGGAGGSNTLRRKVGSAALSGRAGRGTTGPQKN